MTAAFIPAPVKPPISKVSFDALDIRVGQIESVANIEGTDKLVALRVDFGDHMRTIVAGIRLERDAGALIGRQSLFVVNMEPRKMRGVYLRRHAVRHRVCRRHPSCARDPRTGCSERGASGITLLPGGRR